MRIESLQNSEKLNLCRKYFLAGFALLPFMWAVNAVWFFKEAFIVPTYAEQKKIRTYVIISALGALLWLGGIITWILVFQKYRSEWGVLGDNLSFIIPKGIA
ncbi:Gamma-secretase subunit PEN-2 [Armadillidium nasatum]|uniref:Gamma-secretase subunit PEN-2 n=1 Tax=Armadillidium nasatum TaxID=96803 RepID=A0A5N5TN63_9CRUS|nr:Gamma-secretase subunit PEN-2 [Armadillidium nasatum]